MIKDRHSLLEDVLRRIGRVTHKEPIGQGDHYQCRCPAHKDDVPSLSVSAGVKGIVFKCFAGCEAEAVVGALGLKLADLFYESRQPERQSYTNELHDLGSRRGWRVSALEALGCIGEHGRVQFPMRDAAGKVTGAKLRRANNTPIRTETGEVKSWSRKGSTNGLIYAPPLSDQDPVLVCEGEADTVAVLSASWTAVVGTAGANAGKQGRRGLQKLLAGRQCVLAPHPDQAGSQWRDDIARLLSQVQCHVNYIAPDQDKDLDDRLRTADQPGDLLQKLVDDALPWLPPGTPTPHLLNNAIPFSPLDFPCTDAGNGELFRHFYANRLRYYYPQSAWFVWRGHWWAEDENGEVVRLAKATARARYAAAINIPDANERLRQVKWALRSEGRGRIDACLTLAQAEHPLADASTDWNGKPWLLGAANGVVDLQSGELRIGQPQDRITMHTPVAYNAEAECPRWQQFLAEVFQDNADLVDFLHRAVGYTLTGHTHEQCLFICHGTGSNGKTVFLETLRYVLGPFAYDAGFSTFELKARSQVPVDVAALVNKRLVTASETGISTRLNEARLKALTGGDTVNARQLYCAPFNFEPVAKIWLSVNHKPRVADDSYGFWRRVRLIPFARVFAGDEADPHLKDQLRAEAPGILNWAVAGCLVWQSRGLQTPACIADATDNYQVESDPLGEWLLARCELADAGNARAATLYADYRDWAEDAGMSARERLSRNMWGRYMKGRFQHNRDTRGILYHGLCLRGRPQQVPL